MSERKEKTPTRKQIMAANSLEALLDQELAMEIVGYQPPQSDNSSAHTDKRVPKRIEEAGELSQEIIVKHKSRLDEVRKGTRRI